MIVLTGTSTFLAPEAFLDVDDLDVAFHGAPVDVDEQGQVAGCGGERQ